MSTVVVVEVSGTTLQGSEVIELLVVASCWTGDHLRHEGLGHYVIGTAAVVTVVTPPVVVVRVVSAATFDPEPWNNNTQ